MSHNKTPSQYSAAKLAFISRPRFWIYVFGPYIVGMLIGARHLDDLNAPLVYAFGLFFTLPANLLIYGVNDIFDFETDKLNPKKTGYEVPVAPDETKQLMRWITLLCLPFALLLPFTNTRAIGALIAFLFFSLGYSAPPIRAKARPIVDAMFNVLYICPGIFAYYLLGGQNFTPAPVVAAWLWAMAMHAYSAVPDISSDRSVGLNTVATLLGFKGTLVFCACLYAASALLTIAFLGALSWILGALYVGLMMWSLKMQTEARLLRVYKIFPLVNTLAGAALFFWVLKLKFFAG